MSFVIMSSMALSSQFQQNKQNKFYENLQVQMGISP